MKRTRLTRKQSARLARNQSELAETLAAEAYGFDTFGASNFDGVRDSGMVFEVKSTVTEYDNGARGRFRLFEDQHTELTRRDRTGAARYVFVLFDVSKRRPEALMVMKQPAKIGSRIGARGGWNQSGHPAGRQNKLPYSVLFDR